MRFSLFVSLILVALSSARGAEPDFPTCGYPRSPGISARITGRHRVVLAGVTACGYTDPQFGAEVCKKVFPYVIPGDQVLAVQDPVSGYVCIRFSDGKQETDGWVPKASLLITGNPPHPALSAWEGHWSAVQAEKADSAVDVTVEGRDVHITGMATNGGGGFWFGNINGKSPPSGNTLLIDDPGPPKCRVTFTLHGHYLEADDQNGCGEVGGGNFSGLYVRTGKAIRTGHEGEP